MKKILLFIFIFSFIVAQAQQVTNFSQHAFDRYSVNPSFAGSETYTPVNFLFKRYWTGFDEAPQIQELNGHGKILRQVGAGGRIFHFETGPVSKLGAEMSYAFHIPIHANGTKLSFGLSGMVYQYHLDLQSLDFENPNDPAIFGAVDKLIVPDAAAGFNIHNQKFHIGMSAYQLLNQEISLMAENLAQQQAMHYYAITGYKLYTSEKFMLYPNALVKYTEPELMQFEAGLIMKYDPVFVGFAYRDQEAAVMMFGLESKTLSFGYAYDYLLSGIADFSDGSHELRLSYKFNLQEPKLNE